MTTEVLPDTAAPHHPCLGVVVYMHAGGWLKACVPTLPNRLFGQSYFPGEPDRLPQTFSPELRRFLAPFLQPLRAADVFPHNKQLFYGLSADHMYGHRYFYVEGVRRPAAAFRDSRRWDELLTGGG